MDIKKFASDLPYPEVNVKPCIAQSKLLMPSYAGVGGEMTAIASYSFQSFISGANVELENALLKIAKVEMLHLRLLGKAISKLGGYPILGARNYWSGSVANYTLTPKKFLQQNIASEEATIINYERTILSLADESVKMLIERIILDEELHIKIFEELLKQV